MQALISPIELRETGYRVAQVSQTSFEVADPLFWVACPEYVLVDRYWYNPENKQFVEFPLPDTPRAATNS